MRWFKHMTNTVDDEKISKLVDECGLEGYGFFWRVLEMIAAQVNDDGKNYCSYSKRVWCNKLAINHQTWGKLIASCDQAGLFEVSSDGQTITVISSNILKYRDEYSKKKGRKSGQCPDNIRTDSGPSRARVPETDTETETELEENTPPTPASGGSSLPVSAPPGSRKGGTNPKATGTNPRARQKPTAYSADFEAFWLHYPRKVGKDAAWKVYQRRRHEIPRGEDMAAILARHCQTEQWQREAGQYIPLPATWLNQGRWKDDVQAAPPKREIAPDAGWDQGWIDAGLPLN